MNGEVIFMRLTDVGRNIHLKEASVIFPGIPDKKIIKTKDTPSYLDFPECLRLDFQQEILTESKFINNADLQIKLYADGVISLIARIKFTDLSLNMLHTIRRIKFSIQEKEYNISEYLKFQTEKTLLQIKEHIEEPEFAPNGFEHEKYTLYCITDNINPSEFVENKE
jgi:hypothetical protein